MDEVCGTNVDVDLNVFVVVDVGSVVGVVDGFVVVEDVELG